MVYVRYTTAFLLAVVLSYVATRVMRSLALRAGIVDEPDGFRKTHKRPTPLLGGVGVYLAFFIALPVASMLEIDQTLIGYLSKPYFWKLLAGGTAGGASAERNSAASPTSVNCWPAARPCSS